MQTVNTEYVKVEENKHPKECLAKNKLLTGIFLKHSFFQKNPLSVLLSKQTVNTLQK